jgi:hypothetical protein
VRNARVVGGNLQNWRLETGDRSLRAGVVMRMVRGAPGARLRCVLRAPGFTHDSQRRCCGEHQE